MPLCIIYDQISTVMTQEKIMRVDFTYYSDGESGTDTYRMTSEAELNAKVQELRQAIEDNFAGCLEPERIDEDDFFGIMDHASGDFAKIIVTK